MALRDSRRCDSQVRATDATPTNVRTDELTTPLATIFHVADPNVRGDEKIGVVVDEVERFPVVRSGERAEIPWDVRRAVYRRDGWRCKFCGRSWRETQLDLDHIVPWSAGGPDHGSNLRTLCHDCNIERSNYKLNGDSGRVLPVTWWCLDCHGPYDPEDLEQRAYVPRPDQVRPNPPRIEPHDRLTFAYCATCDINGYTEVAL